METPIVEKTTTTSESKCCDTSTLLHNRSVQSALALALILLTAFLFAETIKSLKEFRYVGGGIAPSNAITVSGEGEKFIVPDTAEFTFSVLEEGKTSAEVQEKATTKTNDTIKALKESGIEEKDIKTIGYDLYPKYEWKTDYSRCVGTFPCEGKQEQVGFELNQTVSVKVRDLDKAGEKLELVTSKGVSNVSGLMFTVAEKDAVQAEVRKLAIDDARAKADKLARDLGVSLVRIVGFSEGGNDYSPKLMYARDMEQSAYGMGGDEASVAPSLPAGENRFVSNVSITYEIR